MTAPKVANFASDDSLDKARAAELQKSSKRISSSSGITY